jgi:hypothetical protein
MAITMNGFDDYQVLAKYMWANSLLIVTGISLVKISLGFFLLRFAQKAVWKRFIIGMIGMTPMLCRSLLPPLIHSVMLTLGLPSVPGGFYTCLCWDIDLPVHTCERCMELYTKTHSKMLLE